MRENEPVDKLLIARANQVRSGAEMLLEKTRDVQLIQEFISNRNEELELTPVQEKKLQRYQFVYDQLASGKYNSNQVATLLTKTHGVKISQAYEDIRLSKELFASVININKRFELNNEIEVCKSARAKCLELHEYKNAALFGKLIKELLALLPDEEENPGQYFEGYSIDAVFDPRLLGAPEVDMAEVLKAINEKRKVPIVIDMFTEIPFEDLPDGK